MVDLRSSCYCGELRYLYIDHGHEEQWLCPFSAECDLKTDVHEQSKMLTALPHLRWAGRGSKRAPTDVSRCLETQFDPREKNTEKAWDWCSIEKAIDPVQQTHLMQRQTALKVLELLHSTWLIIYI